MTDPLDNILSNVSDITGVRLHELMSSRKQQGIVDAKQIYVYLAVETTSKSYIEIARAISKDHTTVMHAYKKAKYKVDVDMRWLTKLRRVVKQMSLPLVV
jgi:chromosomal replication initiator protein